ncbi:MAG: ribosome maturation factor RimM [Balneolaceae bacterium]|nr:ribosome maturation factor RimM [Balneolaceae bacterium]
MDTSDHFRFIEIGRFGKAHGLDGEVRFLPKDPFKPVLFDRIPIYYMKNQRSDMVPVRLVNARTVQKQKQLSFFVQFDVIASRTDAEEAMDKALYVNRLELESVIDTDEHSEEPDMTGYSVICDGSERGKVLDVLENPAHPILEIRYGSGSLLVPFVDEYVTGADHEKGALYCRNLDQLI